jgi:hypothetical protein
MKAALATMLLAALLVPNAAQSQDRLAQRDVSASAYYSLQVDGQEIARFTAVSETVSRSGPTLTLTRDRAPAPALEAWIVESGENPTAARKSSSLIMYDSDHKPVARYELDSAWLSGVDADSSRAATRATPTQSVTIAYERMQRIAQ